jgi:hypothetical protein
MEISSIRPSSSQSAILLDSNCFRPAYLRTATAEELNAHRVELYDRCQYAHSAAKYAAMYIFDEAPEVFDHHLPTKVIYNWLKDEFGLRASCENFYKACQLFPAYTNRK